MLQKLVIRLIHFLPCKNHSLPFFVTFNLLPIKLLYVLMHDVSNSFTPESLCIHISLDQLLLEISMSNPLG